METLSIAAKIRANIQELFEANLLAENAYIRFLLGTDITAFLSMEEVQESILINAEQITPLPCMPPSVIGMMNSRDRVFCVFDLAQLLGLVSPIVATRQYQVIVLQNKTQEASYVGLAVTKFLGMVRLSREQIQVSVADIASEIKPYVSALATQNDSAIPILDFNSLMKTIAK